MTINDLFSKLASRSFENVLLVFDEAFIANVAAMEAAKVIFANVAHLFVVNTSEDIEMAMIEVFGTIASLDTLLTIVLSASAFDGAFVNVPSSLFRVLYVVTDCVTHALLPIHANILESCVENIVLSDSTKDVITDMQCMYPSHTQNYLGKCGWVVVLAVLGCGVVIGDLAHASLCAMGKFDWFTLFPDSVKLKPIMAYAFDGYAPENDGKHLIRELINGDLAFGTCYKTLTFSEMFDDGSGSDSPVLSAWHSKHGLGDFGRVLIKP